MAKANGAGPPLVPPQPVQEVCQVGQALGPDAKPYVIVTFHGPTGTDVHFLDGDSARIVGEELVRLARLTKVGLHTPGS